MLEWREKRWTESAHGGVEQPVAAAALAARPRRVTDVFVTLTEKQPQAEGAVYGRLPERGAWRTLPVALRGKKLPGRAP